MVTLQFPAGNPRGKLNWRGSWTDQHGPVLATGTVTAPDGEDIDLHVSTVTGVERQRDGWSLSGTGEPEDLTFLRELPPNAITSLAFGRIVPDTVAAIEYVAPGLRRLTLQWADLDDSALVSISKLRGLRSLQTFGNRFTDAGVQQLRALTNLEWLGLEEETLSVAAFVFAHELPRLQRLGVMDVPLTRKELARLKASLPHVDVG